jgi:hypothetical protein
MGAQNTRKGPWRELRRRWRPIRRARADRYNPKTGKFSAMPFKRKQPCSCEQVAIKGKLVLRDVKTKWMNRHFTPLTHRRELERELRDEDLASREPWTPREATIEELLGLEEED